MPSVFAISIAELLVILGLLLLIGFLAAKYILPGLSTALGGGGPAPPPSAPPPPPLPPWYRTIEDLRVVLEQIKAKDLKSEEDCVRLRALLQKLRDQSADEI